MNIITDSCKLARPCGHTLYKLYSTAWQHTTRKNSDPSISFYWKLQEYAAKFPGHDGGCRKIWGTR